MIAAKVSRSMPEKAPPVEDSERQVTKAKLIKRSMYGKAGFTLLRSRVLHVR
jgi:hypothetical protein